MIMTCSRNSSRAGSPVRRGAFPVRRSGSPVRRGGDDDDSRSTSPSNPLRKSVVGCRRHQLLLSLIRLPVVGL